MVKDTSRYSREGSKSTIRRQDKRELPEDVVDDLRDAAWAGLAQKLQAEIMAECEQKGHDWVEGPNHTIYCKRCTLHKKDIEEPSEEINLSESA